MIAPVALFLATLYTLNRLNRDSELIVMSAGGMPPQRLLRPFLALATFVCLIVGVISIYLMPASFQEMRPLFTKIGRISTMAKEGQFITLENGFTFHYREKSGDSLLGIFMEDLREKDKPSSISPSAARRGANGNAYLVLQKGSVQRKEPNSRDSSIVAFERYAVDLSAFNKEEAMSSTSRASEHDPAPVPGQERASTRSSGGASGPNCTTACPPGSIRWP